MLKRDIDMYVCTKNDCINAVSYVFESIATERLVILFLCERDKLINLLFFTSGSKGSIAAGKTICIAGIACEYNFLRLVTVHNHPYKAAKKSTEDDFIDRISGVRLGLIAVRFVTSLIF